MLTPLKNSIAIDALVVGGWGGGGGGDLALRFFCHFARATVAIQFKCWDN